MTSIAGKAIRSMSAMTYEHEWARRAREEVCRLPILDYDELELFKWYVEHNEVLVKKLQDDARVESARVINSNLSIEASIARMADPTKRSTAADAWAQRCEDAGESWIPVDYFVKRIRYGQVIQLVSLVELFLTRACERLTIVKGEQSLNELSGEKLARRKKFLERYGQISVSESLWKQIEEMVYIRNICVHEDGCVTAKGNTPIVWPSGVTDDQGELVLEPAYLSACQDAVRALFEDVQRQLR